MIFRIRIDRQKLKIFSYNKFNIISFYEKIMVQEMVVSIKDWVIDNLKKNNINTKIFKLKLLCYPRIFGYVFNPLSVFYIIDKIQI